VTILLDSREKVFQPQAGSSALSASLAYADDLRQKQLQVKAAKEAKAKAFEERRLANEEKRKEADRLYELKQQQEGGS
jgi:hypothetical protein